MKPNERLREARIKAGFKTARAASEAHGWAQKTYYSHEAGSAPLRARALDYARAFDVSVDDLVGKEDYIEVKTPLYEMPIINISDMDAFTSILRGSMSVTRGLSSLYACEGLSFGIVNPNRAMTAQQNPRIFPDDILVFDPAAKVREGDFILARVPGEFEPLFRAYTKLSNGSIALTALNPLFEKRTFKPEGFQIIGRLAFVLVRADTIS